MRVPTGCDKLLWSPAEHLHHARRWFQAWLFGGLGTSSVAKAATVVCLSHQATASCLFVQGNAFSGYDIELGAPLLLQPSDSGHVLVASHDLLGFVRKDFRLR